MIGDANRFAHAAALAVAEQPARPTTRCSSTARPASARPTSCTRIGNYVRALRRRADRPLHDRRALHERVPRRRSRPATSTPSSTATAATTCCSSTTSSSSSARPRPRRSSSTPSTRCTRPAASSCSPPTARRATSRALEDRLRERFESGLRRRHPRPGPATRLTVLRKRVAPRRDRARRRRRPRAHRRAHRPTNMRALEGALIRVVAYASLTGRADRPPTWPTRSSATSTRRAARSAAAGPPHGRAHPGSCVAEAFGVTPRGAAVAEPRGRASPGRARSPCTSRASTPTRPCRRSAARFGGRDHTTVLHACKRTAERIGRPIPTPTRPSAHLEPSGYVRA